MPSAAMSAASVQNGTPMCSCVREAWPTSSTKGWSLDASKGSRLTPIRSTAGPAIPCRSLPTSTTLSPATPLRRGSEEDRCDSTLHVVGAAAVQAAVLDARLVGHLHPGDADRVEVAVQKQRASAAGAAPRRDHARPLVPDDQDVEPAVRAPLGDERRKLAFPPCSRNEPGIDGVDRDEPRRQLG